MCGTPCVAFEVGGIPEMLNERNGILVKRGNPVALKEALEKALGSNWNYNHISQDATSIYDIKNIGHKYVALYQGIL
jgi:glycosyltransferase involved in cell wall biosynthesis